MVPVLFIGFSGIGIVAYGTLESADQILPYMITQLNLPAVLFGLVAAAMSSSDTITHGAASVYTLDLHKKIINPNISDKKAVKITRIAVVIFCTVAYCIAVFGAQSLVGLLLGAYGSIVQFFPICVAVFFWPRSTRQGAIAGLLTGIGINYYVTLSHASFYGLHSGLVGLLGNAIVLIIVSLATKPQEASHVMKFVEESQIPVDEDQSIIYN